MALHHDLAGFLPNDRHSPRVNATRPIEIIGGGLAGLSLGLALQRAGVAVTLFEAGRYPRHRVCGEFITGLTPATISRLALEPFLADALRHREVAWFHREKTLRIQSLPTPALGLSRHALDDRMASAFAASGGKLFANTRAADLTPQPGRVLATGRRRGDSSWIGLKIHARRLSVTRDLELHLADETYVGLSAIEGGEINLCGLFRQRRLSGNGVELLVAYLEAAGLPSLAARLACAETDPASFCAVAALSFASQPCPVGTICLGDAHGLIPPFTGNGMALAFQSAEAALDPLLAYASGELDWDGACAAANTAIRRRFRARLLTARALHSFFLQPKRQRWLSTLARTRLLPLRPLYALLH